MRCLNWRVVAALGLLALGVAVVAPEFGLPTLMVAAALACPLSMMLMMRGQALRCRTPQGQKDAEIARLRAEVEELKAERPVR